MNRYESLKKLLSKFLNTTYDYTGMLLNEAQDEKAVSDDDFDDICVVTEHVIKIMQTYINEYKAMKEGWNWWDITRDRLYKKHIAKITLNNEYGYKTDQKGGKKNESF